MPTRLDTITEIGIFELIWMKVENARLMADKIKKTLSGRFDDKNTKLHLKNVVNNTLINTIDAIWQEYFGINGYKKSIYWSSEARQKFHELIKDNKPITSHDFVRDHVVPKQRHAIELLKIESIENLKEYMVKNYLICVITSGENSQFSKKHIKNIHKIPLVHEMPTGWKPTDGPWSRYDKVAIDYFELSVRLQHDIYKRNVLNHIKLFDTHKLGINIFTA